ncbi:MAG TPA: hypothetical protein PKN33_14005 [Phycisphaerae bacterium]|nr:hypothetical protein [Phycisphaerae bacterium]
MKSIYQPAVLGLVITASCASIASAGTEHHHDEDFIVGRSSSGQLAVEFNSDEAYELPEVLLIPGDGFGLDDPGFTFLDADEPGEDFYTLAPSVEIAIELVSKDADLQVLEATLFSTLLATPGDQWAMPAGNSFDEHPYWFVDDPDFSELGETFAFSFKLVDLSGTYTDSTTYNAEFIAVPEPQSLVLGLMGAVALVRRRNLRK